MFQYTTPEAVGVASQKVLAFYKKAERLELSTHSVIMSRGDKIFSEAYYAPFHKDFQHRMYSVSKSFVGIAVGFCVQDGLIGLEDHFLDYFPDYDHGSVNPQIESQTVRDMLCMQTAVPEAEQIWWFGTGTKDRTECYFQSKYVKMPGTTFEYDSPGTYMLTVMVERVTGKSLMEYLREKVLREIGFSETAYCLTVPGGHAFGDSGIMCTAYDLLLFARFVMNLGKWNEKQILDESFLRAATTAQVSSNENANFKYYNRGYGYQIWGLADGGFAFIGMGDQLAICHPKTDSVFIVNSDNQGNPSARDFLFDGIFDIIESFGEPLEENAAAFHALQAYTQSAKLVAQTGETSSEILPEINGKTYVLEPNPMEMEWLRVQLDGDCGELVYKNKQGEKELRFGICKNEFSKFPQADYADLVATVPEKGNYYDCAASAAWVSPKVLLIKVQIIDKYFGRLSIQLSYKENAVYVRMDKVAEAFLNEYTGRAIGYLQ